MSTRLIKALDSNRQEVEAGLLEAQEELRKCMQRCDELRTLILRAETALGMTNDLRAKALKGSGETTLHAEIAAILRDTGNRGMTARELALEVNTRGRYRRRDTAPVELNQIHARVHNYPQLFDKRGKLIYVRPATGEGH